MLRLLFHANRRWATSGASDEFAPRLAAGSATRVSLDCRQRTSNPGVGGNIDPGNTVPFNTPRTKEEQISDTIDAVHKLIAERLSVIDAEARQLQRALRSMGERDGSALATQTPRRKRAAGNRQRRAQAPRGRRREQLLAAIGAKPGARPSELVAEIGIAPGQVSTLLAKARADKLVVKKGAGYALRK